LTYCCWSSLINVSTVSSSNNDIESDLSFLIPDYNTNLTDIPNVSMQTSDENSIAFEVQQNAVVMTPAIAKHYMIPHGELQQARTFVDTRVEQYAEQIRNQRVSMIPSGNDNIDHGILADINYIQQPDVPDMAALPIGRKQAILNAKQMVAYNLVIKLLQQQYVNGVAGVNTNGDCVIVTGPVLANRF
jgi:hypothetical protein